MQDQQTPRWLTVSLLTFVCVTFTTLLIVYIADPALYAAKLGLVITPQDRYPWPVNVFLGALTAFLILLIIGFLRHWRWLYWPMLLAFSSSVIRLVLIPLQISQVVPSDGPVWYSLMQLGTSVFEVCLAIAMIRLYRKKGVWGLGK